MTDAAQAFIAEADQRVDEAIAAGSWDQAREAVSYALWRVESEQSPTGDLLPIANRALEAFGRDPLLDGSPVGTAWREARQDG